MKKIQILIITSILGSCSNLKYLDAFDGFKNKPKEIESTTFRVKYIDSLPNEKIAFKEIYFYDSKGRKFKNKSFNSDGSLSSGGWNYYYDKFGNITQNTLYNKDSSIIIQNNYKYNKFGQQIEREYISYGKKSITKNIYDRKNRIQEIIGKKSDGSFKEKAIQQYDKQWKKKELISYDIKSQQKSRIEFFYDKNGNENQSKWYDSQNKLYEYSNSTYNSKNDRIRIKKYRIRNGESKLVNDIKTEYKYDEIGNCIEEKLILNGKVSWITKNKFKYVW